MKYRVMFFNEDGSFYFVEMDTLDGIDLSDKRVFELGQDNNYWEIYIT
jgi:hypothetical protein